MIASHGEAVIEYEATPGEPGPFNCRAFFGYYDGGIHSLEVSVKGTWVAPRNATHGSTIP